MVEETIFAAFREIGRDLFLRGLVSSHGGNMSVRTPQGICITRTRCMLGRITRNDVVEADAVGPGPNDSLASSELIVHRAIYRSTGAGAVLHAHPPHATLLSMVRDALVPIDPEGCSLLQKVSIVSVDRTVAAGSPESTGAVSEALRAYGIVMLKKHGSFARGDTLEDAYMLTSCLEASSFYLYRLQGL